MLLVRILLTKRMEIYELRDKLYGETLFVLIYYDHRRPSCYEDFSYLPSLEEEDFISARNYLQAVALYNEHINDSEKEQIYDIVCGFMEGREDCDWNLQYVKYDLRKLKGIKVNKEFLITKMAPVLKKLNIPNELDSISIETFDYLMQE